MVPVPESALSTLAARYGTSSSALTHFGGGRIESDGIVYRYRSENGDRLLKILVVSEAEKRIGLLQLDERLRFAAFLGDNDVRVAYPRLSPKHNLYETHCEDGDVWIAYCMDIAPGVVRCPCEWDQSFVVGWGQIIGKMHRLASEYASWLPSTGPETGEKILGWRREWEQFYRSCQDVDVKQKWVDIRNELETLPTDRSVFGFTHNDLHAWNLLSNGLEITVIDFDCAGHHWFVNDIAIACTSLMVVEGGMGRPYANTQRMKEFFDLFLSGYRREFSLPPDWLGRVDLFVAYRRLLLFTIMENEFSPTEKRLWKQTIGVGTTASQMASLAHEE